jgi:CBS domain-containing protein
MRSRVAHAGNPHEGEAWEWPQAGLAGAASAAAAHLLVVSEEGKMQGIVTTTDILHALKTRKAQGAGDFEESLAA